MNTPGSTPDRKFSRNILVPTLAAAAAAGIFIAGQEVGKPEAKDSVHKLANAKAKFIGETLTRDRKLAGSSSFSLFNGRVDLKEGGLAYNHPFILEASSEPLTVLNGIGGKDPSGAFLDHSVLGFTVIKDGQITIKTVDFDPNKMTATYTGGESKFDNNDLSISASINYTSASDSEGYLVAVDPLGNLSLALKAGEVIAQKQ